MGTVRRRWVIVIAMIIGSFALGAAVAWTTLHNPFVFGGEGGGLADQSRQFFATFSLAYSAVGRIVE